MLSVIYAESQKYFLYAECHYGECRYAECLGAVTNTYNMDFERNVDIGREKDGEVQIYEKRESKGNNTHTHTDREREREREVIVRYKERKAREIVKL